MKMLLIEPRLVSVERCSRTTPCQFGTEPLNETSKTEPSP
jgi:hypothetical protein